MLILGIATASARGAEAPVEGAWGARTSAALPVTFEVHEGRVENAHFTFLWGFCGGFESALANVDPVDAEGRWTFLDTRGPRISATFVAPDRAEGTVEAPSRELPGCPKTEATFVARPGPVPPLPPVRRHADIALLRPVTEGGHRTFRGLEYRLLGRLPAGTSRYGTTVPADFGPG
jgi:hypothetical protein